MLRHLAVLTASLSFAHASPPPGRAYTRATALTAAMFAAREYWGLPACGEPRDTSLDIAAPTIGLTVTGTCHSYIASWIVQQAPNGPEQFGDLCQVVTHEWGHLMLGPNFFADSNPANPSESPDPRSIMALSLSSQMTPECVEAMNHRFGRTDVHVTLTRTRCVESSSTGEERWPCVFAPHL